MKRSVALVTLLLGASFLQACCTRPSEEELSVYSAFLAVTYSFSPQGRLYVGKETTFAGSDTVEDTRLLTDLVETVGFSQSDAEELVDDLIWRNRLPACLPAQLSGGPPFALVEPLGRRQRFADAVVTRARAELYESWQVVAFSRVGFNKAHTLALVATRENGGVTLLRKCQGTWQPVMGHPPAPSCLGV